MVVFAAWGIFSAMLDLPFPGFDCISETFTGLGGSGLVSPSHVVLMSADELVMYNKLHKELFLISSMMLTRELAESTLSWQWPSE